MYIYKTLIYLHPELDRQNRKGINKYTHALARKYELEKTQRESMSAKTKSRDLRPIKERESATARGLRLERENTSAKTLSNYCNSSGEPKYSFDTFAKDPCCYSSRGPNLTTGGPIGRYSSGRPKGGYSSGGPKVGYSSGGHNYFVDSPGED
jgi:hypothetical protein